MKQIMYILALMFIGTFSLFAQKVDRAKPPINGEIPDLQIPAPVTFTLNNGLNVYHLEKNETPLIQLLLCFRAGSSLESPKQQGLANLTARMLMEGAGSRDALAFADEMDYLGIDLSVTPGRESSTLRLFTPTHRFDPAIELVRDMILSPAFNDKDLERVKKEILVSLVQAHDEPRQIANTAFNQQVFGKTHPYGRTAIGNEETLRTLTKKDLQSFHAAYYAPNLAYAVVVGAIGKSDLQNKLETAFKNWKPGKAEIAVTPDAPPTKGRTIYLIDKPGAAQTEIRVGCVGAKRSSPDYYAITVLNTILGGSFTSRLNNNLRETHGYTYGASSRFGLFLAKGAFSINTSVETAVTDKALAEIFKELTNIRVISNDDLTKARNYVALGYPSEFEGIQALANMIDEQIFYNLPDNYFNTYIQRILSVRHDEVIRAASTYILPENMVVVLVGDAAKIEKPVRALQLGKIVRLKKEEVLGKIPKI